MLSELHAQSVSDSYQRSFKEQSVLKNRTGKVLYADPLQDGVDLSDRNLQGAIFAGSVLHGLDLSGSDLREADFSNCDLYWLNLFNANCNGCVFTRAVLEGANLKSACFRNADFSMAKITADRLGRPSSLAHANLEGAKLNDAALEGTQYDAKTVFPSDFNPKQHGMVLVPIVDDWLIVPDCA